MRWYRFSFCYTIPVMTERFLPDEAKRFEAILEGIADNHLKDWYRGLVAQHARGEIAPEIIEHRIRRLTAIEESRSPRTPDDEVWAVLLAFDTHLF